MRTEDDGVQVGGLFIPQEAEPFLQKTLADYAGGGGTDAAKKRLEQIDRISPPTVRTLWFDRRPLPEPGQQIWWDCWCWTDRFSLWN